MYITDRIHKCLQKWKEYVTDSFPNTPEVRLKIRNVKLGVYLWEMSLR
jgi:hypothetical protein